MSATATTTLQPIPYLAFDGNCAEALRYYEKVLGGTITVMMTNGRSPAAEHFPKEFHDKIMHARLELPGGGLLLSIKNMILRLNSIVASLSRILDRHRRAKPGPVASTPQLGTSRTMPRPLAGVFGRRDGR